MLPLFSSAATAGAAALAGCCVISMSLLCKASGTAMHLDNLAGHRRYDAACHLSSSTQPGPLSGNDGPEFVCFPLQPQAHNLHVLTVITNRNACFVRYRRKSTLSAHVTRHHDCRGVSCQEVSHQAWLDSPALQRR